MKRIALLVLVCVLGVFPLLSQNVTIPDANFLAALIEEGVDTNEDGQISYAEAEVVDVLDIGERLISDLTGIEAFSNLRIFYCPDNQLTSLNVTNNTALEVLGCGYNQLTHLDVSKNKALEGLHCQSNQIISLDISTNTSLFHGSIMVTGLSISDMPTLWRVCVWELPFPPEEHGWQLDTTGSPNVYFTTECTGDIVNIPDTAFLAALIEEGVDTNEDREISYAEAEATTYLGIVELGISDLTGIEAFVNLYFLACADNKLSRLDLTTNVTLESLYCHNNQLISLNISNCTALNYLWADENILTSLDISNNTNLGKSRKSTSSLAPLRITNMPSLFEVCVWEGFSEEFTVYDIRNSPNVYFTTECGDMEAPVLSVVSISLPDMLVIVNSTEDGIVYLVPVDTEKSIPSVLAASIISDTVSANSDRVLSISEIEDGDFWLYAVDLSGNISNHEVITITDVNFLKATDQLRLYPNPSNKLLTIETYNPDCYSIEIHSLNGQLIYKDEMEGNSRQIDMTPFSKGIYFITVRSDAWVRTEKVVKL